MVSSRHSFLTQRHEDAADPRDATRGHGGEEHPPAPPLVHGIPAHEVGGDLHGRTDEEAEEGVDVEVGRVEGEAVVDERVGQPVEGDEHPVAAGHRVVQQQDEDGGSPLRLGHIRRRRRRRGGGSQLGGGGGGGSRRRGRGLRGGRGLGLHAALAVVVVVVLSLWVRRRVAQVLLDQGVVALLLGNGLLLLLQE